VIVAAEVGVGIVPSGWSSRGAGRLFAFRQRGPTDKRPTTSRHSKSLKFLMKIPFGSGFDSRRLHQNTLSFSYLQRRKSARAALEQNYFRPLQSDACGIWLGNDRQASEQMEETRPLVTIEDNVILGTRPQVVCMGSTALAHGTRLTSWPTSPVLEPAFVPNARRNTSNGVRDPELPGEWICTDGGGATVRRFF